MACWLWFIRVMPPKKKSSPVSRYLSKIGKKARSTEQARAAVNARWEKARKAREEAPESPED